MLRFLTALDGNIFFIYQKKALACYGVDEMHCSVVPCTRHTSKQLPIFFFVSAVAFAVSISRHFSPFLSSAGLAFPVVVSCAGLAFPVSISSARTFPVVVSWAGLVLFAFCLLFSPFLSLFRVLVSPLLFQFRVRFRALFSPFLLSLQVVSPLLILAFRLHRWFFLSFLCRFDCFGLFAFRLHRCLFRFGVWFVV